MYNRTIEQLPDEQFQAKNLFLISEILIFNTDSLNHINPYFN